MTTMTGSLIGGFSALLIAALWIFTFHQKFVISIYRTLTYNAYGIHSSLREVFTSHYWFLLKGIFVRNKEGMRLELEQTVQNRFLELFLHEHQDKTLATQKSHNVLISHSCRSIFYYVIKTTLEKALETRGESRIKIALATVHFGSFYRLLRGMEQSLKCTIEFYEVDLKEEDWMLDQDSFVEKELASCDLIIAQHLFGVPFEQERFFALGKKLNLPIVEDCVQSGSLFGKYKSDARSDVVLYSGGLDKTPSCFGAGFGYFRQSFHGKELYDKCSKMHQCLPVDPWKSRFIAVVNQTLHLMIGKNICYINCFIGLLAYVYCSERGDYIKWYPMGLKVRKAKSIEAFQHSESGFCRKPSLYQLWSMMYGMSPKKTLQYPKIAKSEVESRDLLFQHIPEQFHKKLFPWLTPKVLQAHRDNQGISEFSWVFALDNDRMYLLEFMNDEFLVGMINTTWEFNEQTKLPVGKDINENLVYLPNLHHLKPSEIVYVAGVLTRYCYSLEDKERSLQKFNGTSRDTSKSQYSNGAAVSTKKGN
jgi:hypothetical protein